MIDLHCHIIPGVDDGAQTEADSLAMARAAIANGIHTVIATPHHKNGAFENNREKIVASTTYLKSILEAEDIPLQLLAGQETRIHMNMIEDIKNGELLPLNNSRYLFVELPFSTIPLYTEQLLFDIQLEGLIPIIVHPERNELLMKNPARLYDFVQKGALTQITSGSLLGEFGKTIQTFTRQIIAANLTHFIAGDAHNTTTRKFTLREAYEETRQIYGQEIVFLFRENCQLLIDGHSVSRMEPSMIKKRKIFGLF
ncbi:MAG TPA: CpsB/CapC family capsule biosynthesis tyrosine phosphatase [Virgibacillus sp.]|nr:CpsB/CapC family capsule biosynthesis tyrosine phosphatase [Virgibacillus sp.]